MSIQEDRFVETHVAQVCKRGQSVCGDHLIVQRSPEATIVVVGDGIGSGIYANIAAITCANRLAALLSGGTLIQDACAMVADSMHRAKTEDVPYCAFTAARILKNGQYTVLSYDAPAPVLIRDGAARVAEQRFFTLGYELVAEASGVLQEGESLALFSDGVSQAGIGITHALGCGSDGDAAILTRKLSQQMTPARLPDVVLAETERLSDGVHHDDATFVILGCRPARVVHLMTGPPSARQFDRPFVEGFLAATGARIVCGSSTTDMVARVSGRAVRTLNITASSMAHPPEYEIEGIDLVTEGAATLNQAYNILDEDPDLYDEASAVTRLCRMLLEADIVHFLVGEAHNPGHDTITFKQLGVQTRKTIVPMLAEKLRDMGKLVTETHV